jgi:hypothetical protein
VRCGFEPRYVELVPEDELDERYAYFVMMKPDMPGGAMSSGRIGHPDARPRR